jgi:flagellar biosynthesis protein FliR
MQENLLAEGIVGLTYSMITMTCFQVAKFMAREIGMDIGRC